MKSFFNNTKGSALIGIMLTLVIIAALIYGGSFFWGDNTDGVKTGLPATIDKYQGAKDDLAGIEKNIDERNKIMNDLVGNGEKDIVPETDLTKWHLLAREDNNFKIKYPQGWYYTINHQDAKAAGYDLIVGFADSKAVWEQKSPYTIELLIMPKDLEMEDLPGRYTRQTNEDNDKKYVLVAYSQEYKDTIKKMAETFKILN